VKNVAAILVFPTQTEKNVAMMVLLVWMVKLVVQSLDVNQMQNVSRQSAVKCAAQYLPVATNNAHSAVKVKPPATMV